MLVDITLIARESSHRFPPGIRIWNEFWVRDILWDGITREEEDTDEIRSPLHGIDTAIRKVESRPIIIPRVRRKATTDATVIFVAVAISELGGLNRVDGFHGAARGGMERYGVHDIVVHAFKDVDLAVVGPVSADGPEGGPDGTDTAGHVFDICDEEAVGVGFLGVHAYGRPAADGVVEGVVCAEVDCSHCGVDVDVLGIVILMARGERRGALLDEAGETGLAGGFCIDVFHEAVGGILVGEEIEGLEEVGVVVVVGEDIRCLSASREEGTEVQGKERNAHSCVLLFAMCV